MVEHKQLSRVKRERGICTPGVVAEFDLEDVGSEFLYNRPDLAARKLSVGQIFGERHFVE